VGGGGRGVAVEASRLLLRGPGSWSVVGGGISGARGRLTCGVMSSIPKVDNDELALLLPSSRFRFRAFLVRISEEEPCTLGLLVDSAGGKMKSGNCTEGEASATSPI